MEWIEASGLNPRIEIDFDTVRTGQVEQEAEADGVVTALAAGVEAHAMAMRDADGDVPGYTPVEVRGQVDRVRAIVRDVDSYDLRARGLAGDLEAAVAREKAAVSVV